MRPAAADPAAQVDYASLPDHVGYLLRLAQLRVWEDFYARLSATGITPSLYSALVLIERSEEHTSELQSLMRISYAVFCLKKNTKKLNKNNKLIENKSLIVI